MSIGYMGKPSLYDESSIYRSLAAIQSAFPTRLETFYFLHCHIPLDKPTLVSSQSPPALLVSAKPDIQQHQHVSTSPLDKRIDPSIYPNPFLGLRRPNESDTSKMQPATHLGDSRA